MAVETMIDLTLLGRMVERLQAGVDRVLGDYARVRATLDAQDSRFAEMNIRLSSLDMGFMRLAEHFDKFQNLTDAQLHGLGQRQTAVEGRLGAVEGKIGSMDAKLDLILAKLA